METAKLWPQDDYLSLTNLPALVTQTEAEAGTEVAERRWSPERVAQAIAKMVPTLDDLVLLTAAPAAADGIDGQYAIDTSSALWAVYGPKAAGAWPASHGQVFESPVAQETYYITANLDLTTIAMPVGQAVFVKNGTAAGLNITYPSTTLEYHPLGRQESAAANSTAFTLGPHDLAILSYAANGDLQATVSAASTFWQPPDTGTLAYEITNGLQDGFTYAVPLVPNTNQPIVLSVPAGASFTLDAGLGAYTGDAAQPSSAAIVWNAVDGWQWLKTSASGLYKGITTRATLAAATITDLEPGEAWHDETGILLYFDPAATAGEVEPAGKAIPGTDPGYFIRGPPPALEDRVFADSTTVAAAIADSPTDAEIKAFTDAGPHIDTLVYFTGSDTATDAITHLYHVDGSGTITRLFEEADPDLSLLHYAAAAQGNEAVGEANEGLTWTDTAVGFPTDAQPADALIVRETSLTTINGTANISTQAGDIWLNAGTAAANNWIKVVSGSPFTNQPKFREVHQSFVITGLGITNLLNAEPLDALSIQDNMAWVSVDYGATGVSQSTWTFNSVEFNEALCVRKTTTHPVIFTWRNAGGNNVVTIYNPADGTLQWISSGSWPAAWAPEVGGAPVTITGVGLFQPGHANSVAATIDNPSEYCWNWRLPPSANGAWTSVLVGPSGAGPYPAISVGARAHVEFLFSVNNLSPGIGAPTRHDVTIDTVTYGDDENTGHLGAWDGGPTTYTPTLASVNHIITGWTVNAGTTGTPQISIDPDSDSKRINIQADGGPVNITLVTENQGVRPLHGNADGVLVLGGRRLLAETIILPDSANSTPPPVDGQTMCASTFDGRTWVAWAIAGGLLQTEGGGPTSVDAPNSVAGNSNDVGCFQYDAPSDKWAFLFGSDVAILPSVSRYDRFSPSGHITLPNTGGNINTTGANTIIQITVPAAGTWTIEWQCTLFLNISNTAVTADLNYGAGRSSTGALIPDSRGRHRLSGLINVNNVYGTFRVTTTGAETISWRGSQSGGNSAVCFNGVSPTSNYSWIQYTEVTF
ncbi:MAG: hypothetical protein ACR2RB_05520, partial [Gammaproteobacteria bacterium]